MKAKKIVKLIRKGKLVIEKDNIADLRKCLAYCFPKDPGKTSGLFKFYHLRSEVTGEWGFSDMCNLPTIKASELWAKINKKTKTAKLSKQINKLTSLYGMCADLSSNNLELIEKMYKYNQMLEHRIEKLEEPKKEPKGDLELPEGWKKEELVEWEDTGHWHMSPYYMAGRRNGELANLGLCLDPNYEHKIIMDSNNETILISRKKPTL